jgi:general secretion pathway protein G
VARFWSNFVNYSSRTTTDSNSKPVNMRKQSGFTLIEIMVVVVIIGILASVVVPRIMDNPDKARTAKAKNDIRALESALELYRLDNYVYPTTDQGLEALVTRPTGSPEPKNWKSGGYIKKLNKDPWGNDYLYLSPGENGDVDIFSYGADGVSGGEGPNSDIGSWMTD